jgi:putative transposase
MFQERKVKSRRADDATRWMIATLSRMFPWGNSLVNVKPDTLIRWQRKGFRLFWRWKSKPRGRPRLPKDLRQLISAMAADNPICGKERIANELQRKLGIRVSPLLGAVWQQSDNVPFEQSRNVPLTPPRCGDAGRTTTNDPSRS